MNRKKAIKCFRTCNEMLEEKLRKMDKTDPNDRNLHGPMKICNIDDDDQCHEEVPKSKRRSNNSRKKSNRKKSPRKVRSPINDET